MLGRLLGRLRMLRGELRDFAVVLIDSSVSVLYIIYSYNCILSTHISPFFSHSIPSNNYESFQLLNYGPNQFYRSHHDSSMRDDTPPGPRILTFFLYLSDVEEGGETHFNKLGLSVKPKKGRALVWPSVIDKDPTFWDSRMYHEAKDVIKGEKLAANHWIHLNDYVTPNKWGCTGSFS